MNTSQIIKSIERVNLSKRVGDTKRRKNSKTYWGKTEKHKKIVVKLYPEIHGNNDRKMRAKEKNIFLCIAKIK